MQGLSTQKKLSLYATAIVPVHAQRNLNAVPSTVAYRVYQYLADILDADEKSRDSYLRYMSEAETYNFVTSEKRGRGYGSGVHKEYTFVDDPEVVAETLQADIRLEQAEHEENLVKSVVNAQIDDFFFGKLTRRDTDSDTEFISHTVCSNFPTNQSIHLLHWSLKRRPKSSRTRGVIRGDHRHRLSPRVVFVPGAGS